MGEWVAPDTTKDPMLAEALDLGGVVNTGDQVVKERMADMGVCPWWTIVPRDCGGRQFIPRPCYDPGCSRCEPYRIEAERRRAARLRDAWFPVVERMRYPKLMTLTIKSGPNLRERVEVDARSFRRLLDTRLGPRNWTRFNAEALDFLTAHLAAHEPDPLVRAERLAAGVGSLDRFGQQLERFYESRVRYALTLTAMLALCSGDPGLVSVLLRMLKRIVYYPRFRDVLGSGFSSRETTYSDEHGWHVHRHCVIDGEFIPWALLVVLWLNATRGEGQVVDIRALRRDRKSMLEAIKYTFKPASVPLEERWQLDAALKGLKLVWPLGGAKPDPVDPPVCSLCGDPDCCAVGYVQTGSTVSHGRDGAGNPARMVRVYGFGDEEDTLISVHLVNGQWLEYDGLYLDNREIACHSEPIRAGPDPPTRLTDSVSA